MVTLLQTKNRDFDHSVKPWCLITVIGLLCVFGIVAKYEYDLVKIKGHLQEYLNTYFSDQQLIDINNSEEDFNKFIFTQAVYNGMVHKPTVRNGHQCLSFREIEENIRAICGNNSLLIRVKYEYLPAVQEGENYILNSYMPLHKYSYVIHNVERLDSNYYCAKISYIDTKDGITSYLYDGSEANMEDLFGQNTVYTIDEKINIVSDEIKKNQNKYTVVEFIFRYYDDSIFYVGLNT